MILGVTWILLFTFNSIFPRISWNYATTYEIDEIFKSLKAKNSYEYSHKNYKIKHPFYHFPLNLDLLQIPFFRSIPWKTNML